MTFITQLFIKLFSFFLETIGNIATINTCGGYFDEPEVPQGLLIMTFITQLFIKLFSLILETVGTLASYSPCATYFDEPEVPEELTNLER